MKNKKQLTVGGGATIAVLLLLAVLLGFAACGSADPVQTGSDATLDANDSDMAPAESSSDGDGDAWETQAEEAFSFSAKGVILTPGAEAAPILEKLGAANKVFEAQSCVFESMDRIYYYSGFNVTTFSNDESERILSITLSDDSVETGQGVYLGMSEQDVTAVYGPGDRTADGTVVSYYSGDSELRIFFDDGKTKDITFYYLPVQELYEQQR